MSPVLSFAVLVAAATQVALVQGSVGWSECAKSFVGGILPTHSATPSGAVAVCREGTIAIAYDPIMINPALSAYYLNASEEQSLLPGRESFYEDPDLISLNVTQAAVKSDAFNQSWNRGHLAPSHALSWKKDTKHATYTMANIAPQAGVFNQQPWAHFEGSIITMITTTKVSLYVITGVGYKNRANPRRTYDGISVPDYYWKVLCDPVGKKSAGWFGPNIDGHHNLSAPLTVAAIEASYYGGVTGVLFPDEQCRTTEVDPEYWALIDGGGVTPPTPPATPMPPTPPTTPTPPTPPTPSPPVPAPTPGGDKRYTVSVCSDSDCRDCSTERHLADGYCGWEGEWSFRAWCDGGSKVETIFYGKAKCAGHYSKLRKDSGSCFKRPDTDQFGENGKYMKITCPRTGQQ